MRKVMRKDVVPNHMIKPSAEFIQFIQTCFKVGLHSEVCQSGIVGHRGKRKYLRLRRVDF